MCLPAPPPRSGKPASEEQAAAGCTAIQVARLTLVCLPKAWEQRIAGWPAHIVSRSQVLSEQELSDELAAFSAELLAARSAYQRTVYLDVSGAAAAGVLVRVVWLGIQNAGTS